MVLNKIKSLLDSERELIFNSDSDLSEDDLESFDEYTEYYQIDDISEDDDGDPLELNFE